jgi:hypothetical protein
MAVITSFINLTILFFSFTLFYQSPKKTQKIHFVYHIKSNCELYEDGMYADTLLLKQGSLKSLPFQLKKHPKDASKIVGFVEYKNLTKNQKSTIVGIFEHNNIKLDCYYNPKKDQTIVYTNRYENDNDRLLLKKYLNKTYTPSLNNKAYVDYKTNQRSYMNSPISSTLEFDPRKMTIEWFDDTKTAGQFKISNGKFTFTDLIVANPDIDKHITPTYLFSNCEYGIQKVVSIFQTMELISYEYK